MTAELSPVVGAESATHLLVFLIELLQQTQ